MQDCFLCAPDRALVYAESTASVALCGLGPVVDGYSVVATRDHVRSCADAVLVNSDFIPFVKSVRETLIRRYGSCAMTEHGRLPVCTRPTGAEEHCFHAHFLLFPGSPEILEAAQLHFGHSECALSLDRGLALARQHEEYFLLSPMPNAFFVMSRPLDLMRQFARYLVAKALGHPERADWAEHPEKEKAQAYAEELIDLVPDPIRTPWIHRK